MGVNAFTLAAQAINPKITTKLVMIDTWFDPAKEAAAADTLANLGCDVIAQHVDSPAVLQVCEKRKIFGFGYGADMSRFAPNAQLTASLDLWGPYYIGRAKAVLDGSWKSDDVWGGMKEGLLGMAPYNKAVPDNVRAASDKIIAVDESRNLRSLHRPDRGSERQGTHRQGPAHGRQGPSGDGLVRQGRPELDATLPLPALSPYEERESGGGGSCDFVSY